MEAMAMKGRYGMAAALLALVGLVLGGCAVSPQQVEVRPSLPLDADTWGRSLPVAVQVEDRREETILGSRGGIYGESSTVTVSNDLGLAVGRAVNAYLATQGFQTNAAGEGATRLRITVEELTYEAPDTRLGQETRLTAALRAEARRDGQAVNGRYQAEAVHRSVNRPGAETNQRWINQVLSDVLRRMLDDPRLREFLRQEAGVEH